MRHSRELALQAETIFHWDEEDDEHKLGDLLDNALSRAEGRSKALLFTVDDALWFRDFDADAALQLLQNTSEVYAVHAKLLGCC